jgi:hypothetical protein
VKPFQVVVDGWCRRRLSSASIIVGPGSSTAMRKKVSSIYNELITADGPGLKMRIRHPLDVAYEHVEGGGRDVVVARERMDQQQDKGEDEADRHAQQADHG